VEADGNKYHYFKNMNLEFGKEKPPRPIPKKLSDKDMEMFKKDIDDCLEKYHGLYEDVLGGVGLLASPTPCPILHYEDYFRGKFDPEFADYVMEKSDPEKVKGFDALVDEYNSRCEKISKEEKEGFRKRFITLVFGEVENEEQKFEFIKKVFGNGG
jgi:hypothetical protein